MRRSFVPGLAAVLPFFAGALFAAEMNKTSMEFRKNFLDNFPKNSLSTAPGDAMMLRILVESRSARRGIEVGAASGYGAINMGIAFERTGGHLYSLEIDPKAVDETRANLAKVGLEKTVTVMEGDALQTLAKLTGEFDFIFIDAAKNQYLGYLKAVESKLKKGAVVVADNVIKSERHMKDFLTYIQNSPDYETVIIRSSMDKGDGMLIGYKLR
jgi:caffeoyl-CoA O-methyltransferase